MKQPCADYFKNTIKSVQDNSGNKNLMQLIIFDDLGYFLWQYFGGQKLLQ